MGKPRPPKLQGRPPGLSKYARKVASQIAGTYKPPRDISFARVAPPAPSQPNTITAIVVETDFAKGFIILRAEDGRKVILWLDLFKRTYSDTPIDEGWLITCEIKEKKTAEGFRVSKVISVSPPP